MNKHNKVKLKGKTSYNHKRYCSCTELKFKIKKWKDKTQTLVASWSWECLFQSNFSHQGGTSFHKYFFKLKLKDRKCQVDQVQNVQMLKRMKTHLRAGSIDEQKIKHILNNKSCNSMLKIHQHQQSGFPRTSII